MIPFCKMFGPCCILFPDGSGVPCADHFITISVAVIYQAWILVRLMFVFFGNFHFVRNYHFVVILLFVFLQVLHSVVFCRFIITEWSDQPELCNVNGDSLSIAYSCPLFLILFSYD